MTKENKEDEAAPSGMNPVDIARVISVMPAEVSVMGVAELIHNILHNYGMEGELINIFMLVKVVMETPDSTFITNVTGAQLRGN